MTADSQDRVLVIAEQAFVSWKKGLATGEWQDFIAMLSDDFYFTFPVGQYQGINRGKETAIAFFNFVSQIYPDGLTIELINTIAGGSTVVFELLSQGTMYGNFYKNRAAVCFEIKGELISSYREYLAVFYQNP